MKLNPTTTKQTDDAFYASHPEMVKDGKRTPINPQNPAHKGLAAEWMASYRKNAAPPLPTTTPGQTVISCPEKALPYIKLAESFDEWVIGPSLAIIQYLPRVYNAALKAAQHGGTAVKAAGTAVKRINLIPDSITSKVASMVGPALDLATTAIENRDQLNHGTSGVANYAGRITHTIGKSAAGAIASGAVGKVGAVYGAKLGAMVGAIGGPVGIGVGAAVGAVGGAIAGAVIASKASDWAVDKVITEDQAGNAFEKGSDYLTGGSSRNRGP